MNTSDQRVLFPLTLFLLAFSYFILKSSEEPPFPPVPSITDADTKETCIAKIQQLQRVLWERDQETFHLRGQLVWQSGALAQADQRIGGLVAYQYYLENQLEIRKQENSGLQRRCSLLQQQYSALERSYASLQASAALLKPSVAMLWGPEGKSVVKGKGSSSLEGGQSIFPGEDDLKLELDWASAHAASLEDGEPK